MSTSSTTIKTGAANTVSGVQLSTSAYGIPVPILYGTNKIGGNLIWYDGFHVQTHTSKQRSGGKGGGGVTTENTSYTYHASYQFALCEGQITGVLRSWIDEQPVAVDTAVMTGAGAQTPWSYQSVTVAEFNYAALSYPGTAIVCRADAQLGDSGNMQAMTFEVRGIAPNLHGDAWPPNILVDLLSNIRYGAIFPGEKVANWDAWGEYCHAMDLYLSPLIKEKTAARMLIERLCNMTNAAPIWSDGRLKIIPLGDDIVTGNGHTYIPDVTPCYDLSDDDFLENGDEGPLKIRRKRISDAHNELSMTWQDRAQDYADSTTTLQDLNHIERFGLRPGSELESFGVTRPEVAATVVQTALQREVYIRAEYEFRLPWRFLLLEPMDRVTLTDAALGLDRHHVRIREIEEDEQGLLTVIAEDAPLGVSTPGAVVGIGSNAGSGGVELDVEPGDVVMPVVFEPPGRLVTTSLAVWIAVTGDSPNWGGCHVWASIDGTDYEYMGTTTGGARYGQVTADLLSIDAGAALKVALVGNGGQLISSSPEAAAALSTLSLVGGTGGEYTAYSTATLTGMNAYTLVLSERAAMGSSATVHTKGEKFVRVDERIVKSDALDSSLVGKTIRLKFTSFNVYGRRQQDIADVFEYQYTIGGDFIQNPNAAIVKAPVPASPPNGEMVNADEVVLVAEAYKSRPAGIDYHYASQWQIASAAGFADGDILWDSDETESNLTNVLVQMNFALGATYYWRVRYRGEVLAWSEWSQVMAFTKTQGIVGIYTRINGTGEPPPAGFATMAAIGTNIYVVVGVKQFRFDTVTLTWKHTATYSGTGYAPLASDICPNRLVAHDGALRLNSSGNSVSSGGLIYTLNGVNLYCYDPSLNATFGKAIDPIGGLACLSLVADANYIYKIGGNQAYPNKTTAINTVVRYDITADKWAAVAALPVTRQAHVAAAGGGMIFVFGGGSAARALGDSLAGVSSDLFAYDPIANSWTQLPSGPMPVRGGAGMCYCNGALWVFGGRGAGSDLKYNDLWRIT